MTSKPEVIIDASALSKSHCIEKFTNIVIGGLKSKFTYNDTEYGSAGHVFLQTLSKTNDGPLAIQEAQRYFITKSRQKGFQVRDRKDWLTLGHLTLTLEKYLKTFGSETSFGDFTPIKIKEDILVENTFKIPLHEGDKYSYYTAGTIDEVGKLKQGCYAFGDHKFTSFWNKDTFLEDFSHKIQLQFYYFNILRLGELYPTSIFNDIAKQRIGCFINGVFMHKDNPTEFKRSRVFFFNDFHVKGIKEHLGRLIEQMEYHSPYREGMCNDTCENRFGYKCEYLPACLAPNKEAKETVISNTYIKEPYNPLNFRKL